MTWDVATLQDLQAPEQRAITDGPFGSNLARRHYTDSGPRVVRLQNIGDGVFNEARAHISKEHFESLRAHEVRAGDLLVASLGEVLPRACLAPDWLGPAIVKADCIRIRLSTEVDSKWVLYALQRPEARRWADAQRHGVGRPRLGLKAIRRIPIPLPCLDEQRRIVEILEDHLSRLDAGDADLHRAQSRTDALLLAALRAHVEYVRSTGVSFGRIGELAATNLGKMLDAKKTTGELTPYLANINVRWGRFDLENLKLVPLTTEERNRLALLPGDVLVCEGGEPGRCAIWDRDGSGIAYQKALHRVRVHDPRQLAPAYLALMLREANPVRARGPTVHRYDHQALPQEKLRQIEVPIPEHSVQVAALADFAGMADSSERLTAALQTAKSQHAALRRAVLAAAFEGKLTGRHTDDEVIEEMAQ